MSETTIPTNNGAAHIFPFDLSDLKCWIVRRKDGMTIRFNVINGGDQKIIGDGGHTKSHIPIYIPPTESSKQGGFGKWCQHNPTTLPIFSGKGHKGEVELFIADTMGFVNHYSKFDVALDVGGNLKGSEVLNPTIMIGDGEMVKALAPYSTKGVHPNTKVLQIDWWDRKAPPLEFGFWPDLVDLLKGRVLIACVGGHGRSGTGLVCMMMVMNKEYTPADAMIHLRAMHCPRAIESKEQHEYIGAFGKYLGRVDDMDRIAAIKDYKKEFLGLKLASAKPYQQQLVEGKK